MNSFDLAGIPFPLSHDAFASDRALRHKVRALNIHIEMLQEYQQAYSLVEHLSEDDIVANLNQFGSLGLEVPDMLFSFAVLQYAKSFVESQGSINLIGDIPEIFSNSGEKERHDFFMDLRHKFYAHRQYNANSNQLLYHQNLPAEGDIALMGSEQRKHIVMYKTINLGDFLASTWCVIVYLRRYVENSQRNIVDNLTVDQKSYILETDIDQLRTVHQDDGNQGVRKPFAHRNKGS